jgi:hypothetical protein
MRVQDESSMRWGSLLLGEALTSPIGPPASTLMRRGDYDPAIRERLRAALDDMAWRDQGE